MKFKLIFIALFFLLTSAAFANDKEVTLSATRKDSSGVYLVNYSDGKSGKVVLTIKDSRGSILAKRQIQNEKGFVMPLNLSSVGEGVYTVHTDNGTEKQSITIQYNNNTEPTYTRIVNLGENRYLFTTAHIGKETITIKIYDGNYVLLFDENRKIESSYSTIFNLKDVAGEPAFEISETSGHSLMVPGNPAITVVSRGKNVKK